MAEAAIRFPSQQSARASTARQLCILGLSQTPTTADLWKEYDGLWGWGEKVTLTSIPLMWFTWGV